MLLIQLATKKQKTRFQNVSAPVMALRAEGTHSCSCCITAYQLIVDQEPTISEDKTITGADNSQCQFQYEELDMSTNSRELKCSGV